MKLVSTGSILALLALATPSLAAQEAPGVMGQVIRVEPITGHSQPFEEGVRQHSEWVAGQGGQWTWIAFEVVMGPRTGQYLFGTFNHAYADWDTPDVDPEGSAESIGRNVAPHVEDVEVSLIRLHPDLSMTVADAPIAPLYEVVTMEVALGKDAQFTSFMAGLKSAFEAAGLPARYSVFQPAQGAAANNWTVSIPHESFAAMGEGSDLQELTRQTLGAAQSDALWEMAADAIVARSSDVFALRPDLSMNLPPR